MLPRFKLAWISGSLHTFRRPTSAKWCSLAQGERVRIEKAYGKADFQHDTSSRMQTRFPDRLARQNLTAAAIGLLIAKGKVTREDPLSNYLDGIANGDKIRVEQWRTPESGLGEWPGGEPVPFVPAGRR